MTRSVESAERLPHLPSVQILRAVAALLVVTGHVLSEARSYDASGGIARVADWEVWTAGVDLFFVLSGFIMMWTFGERFGQPHASTDFLKRRLTRILPPYWLFTGLMILATLCVPHLLDVARFELQHVMLSLLLVPHIAPHGGIHPILSLGWTLMYEMFFYATFALALLLPRRQGLVVLCIAFLTLHVAARIGFPLPLPLRLFWGDPVMLEFLLGVGFYFAQRHGRLSLPRLVLLVTACLASLMIIRFSGLDNTRLSMFGLPALAILGIAFWMLPEVKLAFTLGLVMVGEASYTLYLSHPFVIEAVKDAVGMSAPAHWSLWFYIPLAMLAATAFSLISYRSIEQRIPRWLLAHLTRWLSASARVADPAYSHVAAGDEGSASRSDFTTVAQRRLREVEDVDGSGRYRRLARGHARRHRARR